MARDQAYQKAEEKIEEARRSGAKKLHPSNWRENTPKLTGLPERWAYFPVASPESKIQHRP
jgi:hypothetical protein